MNTHPKIQALISDVSRTLIFPNEKAYNGTLNALYGQLDPDRREPDFLQYYSFNNNLIEAIGKISKLIPCYLFTSGYLHEVPVVKQKMGVFFKKAFIAQDIGFKKSDKNAYSKLSTFLKVPPENILILDDAKSNCQAAQEAGFQTILITEWEDPIETNNYLSVLNMYFHL